MDRDHEKIRARAYDIWDREGRQDGRDQEYWLRAEQELRAAAAPGIASGAADETVSVAALAPAKKASAAKKANGAAEAVAAKSAPRKRRGAQPVSQA